jgi:hypothetical protein
MRVDMHKQRGAVLIVSLILLLLITAIAVSTISSSTFQTSMAANAQQRESVFRLAESAAEQPLTDDNLGRAYSAYIKAGKKGSGDDRIYTVPSTKLTDERMSAEVLHLGEADTELSDITGVKYFVYESRGFAHSAEETEQDTAKVATEVVQGVAKLTMTRAEADTFDPY